MRLIPNLGRQGKLAAIFIALNLLLLLWAAPEATYIHGGDAALYIGPAKTLWQHGILASGPEALDVPLSFAPPLYAILLAPFVGLLPWPMALAAIVMLQLIMLWFTASAVRGLLPKSLENARDGAQLLVLFNPNAIFTAHLIQPESLFTLLATLALVGIWRQALMPGWVRAIGVGLMLGLATLTRPVALYAIPLLPFLLPLLALIAAPMRSGARRRPPQGIVASGIVLTVTALLCVAPWFARNAVEFGKPFFTSNGGFYLSDQYVELLQISRGLSASEASAERYRQINAAAEQAGLTDFDARPGPERSAFTAQVIGPLILQQAPATLAKALARSWAALFVGGGASNGKNYLDLPGETPTQFLQSYRWQGLAVFVQDFLGQGQIVYPLLVLLTAAFALLMRLAGLLGLWRLWREGETGLLLLLLAELIYFTLSYLFLGQSRFRVPMEPALLTLAALGLSWAAPKRRR